MFLYDNQSEKFKRVECHILSCCSALFLFGAVFYAEVCYTCGNVILQQWTQGDCHGKTTELQKDAGRVLYRLCDASDLGKFCAALVFDVQGKLFQYFIE